MKQYIKLELSCNKPAYTITANCDVEFTCDVVPYMGRLDNCFSKPEDLLLKVKDDAIIENNDKYYFMPGVSIPRVKLKDLFAKNKIKTARDINEATKVFIGLRTIDNLTDYNWLYQIPVSSVNSFISGARDMMHMDEYYINKITTALEFYQEDIVLCSYATSQYFNKNYSSLSYVDKIIPESNSFYYIKPDHVETYYNLIDKDIYSEKSLMKHLNGEDAAIMNESMYESVRDMFNSRDTDNHVLAMEIMANCQFEKSILYIMFLIEEFENQISNQRSRTHVNFKSLLAYLNRTPGNFKISKDDMVSILIEKDLLEERYVTILLDKYRSEVMFRGNSKYFSIRNISLDIRDEKYKHFNEITNSIILSDTDDEPETYN